MTKRRLVILGGGFAGLRALFRLSEIDDLEIVLVDPRSTSLMKPALPEVALFGKSVEHVRFAIEPVVRRAGARFVHARPIRVLAPERRIEFPDREDLRYDYLLITTGAMKDYDAIPGYREHGHSPCDDAEAPRLARALDQFDGGPITIGSARSEWGRRVEGPSLAAPCEGPVGEVMFMLDEELRHRHIRDRASIRVFSPGREFFEDVGPTVRAALAPEIERCGIRVTSQKSLRAIGHDHVDFEDGESWESALTIVIPPYTGNPLVVASEALGDEKGFVPTDRRMRHLDFPEIFAAGDGTALAMPKLGHIAVHQADIAAAALERDLTGRGEIPDYAPEIFCIMNRGRHDATLILSNHLFGGDIDRAFSSPITRMLKWGFDTLYFHSRGHLPPDFAQRTLVELLSRA